MNNFGEKVSFIWSIADLIRDTFKRSKYQDVILPLTVLRRIDCVLQPTKEEVLKTNARLKGKLENLAPQLCRASGYAFYNTSLYDFDRLLADAPHLAANLRAYINGFSDNMREVLEKFDFSNTITNSAIPSPRLTRPGSFSSRWNASRTSICIRTRSPTLKWGTSSRS